MNLSAKFTTYAIIGLFIGGQFVFAQSQEGVQENRLSVGVMGGVSTGHLDVGSAFEAGTGTNFDFQEQLNSTAGINIRYVATRDIALQSNIMLGKFSLLGDYYNQDYLSLKNNYITTSITTQLSLIRLLGAKSENVNVYGSFGGGLMFNNVSVSTTNEDIASRGITPGDHPSSTFFSTFGAGLRFNLGYRLDSFAQYDYHSASRDVIDGNFIGELLALNGSAQTSNSWSSISVGLQYKLGSAASDADWPGVAMRPTTPATTPERDVFEQLEELLTRQADFYEREMEQLSGRVDSLQTALAEERRLREEEQQRRQEERENDPYAAILREMQSRIDSLEQALAAERRIEEPPAGRDEELAEATLVEIRMEAVPVQPERFQTDIKRRVPSVLNPKPGNVPTITMADLAQLIEAPEETEIPETDETVDSDIEKIVEQQPAEIIAEIPEETEETTEALTEEEVIEISFDEMMELAKTIMIQENVMENTDEREEEAIAGIYEKITEQQPEIRLLADSLTIIQALNELKRDLEEDSTIVVADIPDTAIEPPKLEPAERKAANLLDSLDERALKTGAAPEISDDELITEHPVDVYLKDKERAAASSDTDDESETTQSTANNADETVRDADTPAPAEAPREMKQAEEEFSDSQPAEPEKLNWTIFALIAALAAGLIVYLARFFKTEKDLDE